MINQEQEVTIEKTCPECMALKQITEFHKSKDRKDGRQGKCKVCAIAANKKWRKDNPEKNNAMARRWRRNNSNGQHEIHCRYMKLNSRKKYARNAIQRAIKYGKIIRPEHCSQCVIECIPDAHHWSYEKENWLDVIWLCRPCHRKVHPNVKG